MKRPMLSTLLVIVSSPIMAQAPMAQKSLPQIARCLIRVDKKDAAAFASAIPGSEEERMFFALLNASSDRCPPTPASTTARTQVELGGAIAEILLKTDGSLIVGHRFFGFDPKQMDAIGYSETLLADFQAYPHDAAVVLCGISRDPRSSEALLKTRPGSRGEETAFRKLSVSFGRCVYTGETLSLDRVASRAIIARYTYATRFGRDAAPTQSPVPATVHPL